MSSFEIHRSLDESEVESPTRGLQDSPAERPAAIADSLRYHEWDDLVDEVVERIERRVLAELERRGRRYTAEVI